MRALFVFKTGESFPLEVPLPQNMLHRPYFLKTFTLILFLLLTAELHAQDGQSPEDRARIAFDNRLTSTTKMMTTRVNKENAELNDQIGTMNANDPLATRNLDSEKVVDNVSRVLQFIDYLKHTRATSDSLARDFEDSLYILTVALPSDIDSHGIEEMDAVFREDRNALNLFLDAMAKTYSDVLDVLIYLQHTPYTIVKDELTFSAKKDMQEYQKRTKIVDADAKELKKANADMRKANAKASEQAKHPNPDSEKN